MFQIFDMNSLNPGKRIKELKKLLNSGLDSPKSTALSLATGVCLALFPIIGFTALLGILTAVTFRLNHLVVQTLNVVLAPVQLFLIYPFIKAGNLIFAGSSVFKNIFTYTGDWTFLKFLEMITGGILVWFILSILTGPVLYFTLIRVLNTRSKFIVDSREKENH